MINEHDLKDMDLNKYTDWAKTMWVSGSKPPDTALAIAMLGLNGETGEVTEHVKKFLRDGYWDQEAVIKELGDAFYYWVTLCTMIGTSPQEVMIENVRKLESRKNRGVLRGSGDTR